MFEGIIIFNHTEHVRLWDWLANNPGAAKADWPLWQEMDNARIFRPESNCFACETARRLQFEDVCKGRTKLLLCDYCPLDWKKARRHAGSRCAGMPWVFAQWCRASTESRFDGPRRRNRDALEAVDLARAIRDIAVSENVKIYEVAII